MSISSVKLTEQTELPKMEDNLETTNSKTAAVDRVNSSEEDDLKQFSSSAKINVQDFEEVAEEDEEEEEEEKTGNEEDEGEEEGGDEEQEELDGEEEDESEEEESEEEDEEDEEEDAEEEEKEESEKDLSETSDVAADVSDGVLAST